MEEAYINLINAIVLQAFKDYKWAVRKLRRDPKDLAAQRMLYDIESFCHSGWLTMLTEVDGDWLLERIREWNRTS